jgi:hypothetical protein
MKERRSQMQEGMKESGYLFVAEMTREQSKGNVRLISSGSF